MSNQNAAASVIQQLGIATYEMDAKHAIEIQTYLKEGFIKNSLMKNVVGDIESFEAAFTEAVDGDVTSFGVNGDRVVCRSDKLVIIGRIRPLADHIFLEITLFGYEENVNFIMDWASKNKPEPKPLPRGVYSLHINHTVQTPFGRENITHNRLTSQFDDLRDDFYPLINVPMMTKLYAEEDESILILTGEPGTGKTCFVKKTLRELAINMEKNLRVTYIKDVDILKDDNFWATLAKQAPDVLVLDDLDDELLPRTEGRNEIVNHLLSFSDGLFDLPTKVIITTNLSNTAIDDAITRPGRCFEILALPQLTIDQAKSVWKDGFEQTDETFAEVFGSEFADGAKISQASLMSEYKRFTKVGPEAYLKDTSISIREVIQNGGTAN